MCIKLSILFGHFIYRCRVVKLSEEVVECLHELLRGQGHGQGGEVADVRKQDGHVVVLLDIDLSEHK